jgi:hypothetical protein
VNGRLVIGVQWDDSGVAVYFFPRDSVPSDIDAGSPNPDGWGAPMARWPAASCSPFEFFNSHSVIFDTTLWYVPSLFVLTTRQFFNVLLVVTGQVLRGHHQVFPGKNKAARSARVFRLVKRLFKRAGRHLPKHVSGLVAVCKKRKYD